MTLPRFCTCLATIIVLTAFAVVFYYREQDKRLAVAHGCAAFSPIDASFKWVMRMPDPSVPGLPSAALEPGDALGRAVK